ncbi:MAG: exodeoxyribonuclease VII small subunit [Ruminococcaceae bacterium]|nr:exodeoxyribonuclease VII small subunit [Oscillospiraceae bacterium]
MTFEVAMKRLEEVVKALENGETPLDQSLQLFEEGTTLVRTCTDLLNNAEQTVLKLIQTKDGDAEIVPFTAEEA